MNRRYTIKEIAQALGITKQAASKRATKDCWPFEEQDGRGRGGKVKLYHFDGLPEEVRRGVSYHTLTLLSQIQPQAQDDPGSFSQPKAVTRHPAAIWGRSEEASAAAAYSPAGSGPQAEAYEQGLKLWSGVPEKGKQIALARLAILQGEDRYIQADRSGRRNLGKLQELYYGELRNAVQGKDTAAMRRLGFDEESTRRILLYVKHIHHKNARRWKVDYKKAEKKTGVGVLGLVRRDREKTGYGSKTVSPDMAAYVRQLIVKAQVKIFPASKVRDNGRLIDLNRKLVYRRTESTFGKDAMPEYSSFTRWINAYLLQEQEVLSAICLPSYWRSTFAPKGGSASEDVTYAGQVWEMDGTTADVMLRDGRYEIIAAIDVYSRDVVVTVDKHASSITVVRTKFDGIMRWGVPEIIVVDRGTIFISDHASAAAESLGIRLKPCLAYAPWQKPHIESFMAVISKMLFEAMTWYIGHDPKQRRRIEEYDRFTQVFYHSKGEKISCDATADQLRETIRNWLEKVYRVEDHKYADCARHGRPANILERMRQSPRRAKEVKNPEVLDLLLAPRIERNFNSGVQWLNDVYLPVDVASWERAQPYSQRRVIFRPALSDVGRGGLWERLEDGKTGDFICHVSCEARGGMDIDEFNHSRARIEKGHKQRRKAVDLLCNPPSYETELQLMPQPKVVSANFGAEEFEGREYRQVRDRKGGVPQKPNGGWLSEEAKTRLQEEVAEKEARDRALEEEHPSNSRGEWAANRFGLRLVDNDSTCGNGLEDLDRLPEADRYERILELAAQGVDLPVEQKSFARCYEQSPIYGKLKEYYEEKRAMFAMLYGR